MSTIKIARLLASGVPPILQPSYYYCCCYYYYYCCWKCLFAFFVCWLVCCFQMSVKGKEKLYGRRSYWKNPLLLGPKTLMDFFLSLKFSDSFLLLLLLLLCHDLLEQRNGHLMMILYFVAVVKNIYSYRLLLFFEA